MPETTRRYVVMSQGYWSFIFDTATRRYHSHGYDLVSDAELEAERLNAEIEDATA